MNIWVIMILGGILTFGIRFSFIYLLGRVDVPPLVRRALRFVPPAVLSALIVPALLMPSGTLDLTLGNERWLAGLIAILVAWRTKSVLLTILAGIAALVILKLLVFV